MGQKAREIKFRCYFYNETYELHTSVIALLDYHGLLELHHPKYGIIQGMVESMSIRHDDREETAEIDITFVGGPHCRRRGARPCGDPVCSGRGLYQRPG